MSIRMVALARWTKRRNRWKIISEFDPDVEEIFFIRRPPNGFAVGAPRAGDRNEDKTEKPLYMNGKFRPPALDQHHHFYLRERIKSKLNQEIEIFAIKTLTSKNPEERAEAFSTLEPLVPRLRKELEKIRGMERTNSSPARRQKLMSRVDIADIALLLLESVSLRTIQNHPIRLIEELLDLDRHRAAIAANDPSARKDFWRVVKAEATAKRAGRSIGIRALAREADIHVGGSITKWRKSQYYKTLVRLLSGLSKKDWTEYWDDPTQIA